MAENLIFYGPPGTGKTFEVQCLIKNYCSIHIEDKTIKDSYIKHNKQWLVIVLIILQANNKMDAISIASKLKDLGLDSTFDTPTAILQRHNILVGTLGISTSQSPRIFMKDKDDNWYLDLERLKKEEKIYNEYILPGQHKRYTFVTFHQSFVYEDFIEGIRPLVNDSNGIVGSTMSFRVEDGVFKRIVKEAIANPHLEYAIFIYEINRGNIAEIFGELITLIELDKRLGCPNELTVTLPYSKEEFGVPSNLSIFATMNSADRSIANIDFALRRRFVFKKYSTDLVELQKILTEKSINANNIDRVDLIQLLKVINERILILLNENYFIGHAFFINVSSLQDIINVLIEKIVPLLEEYFHSDLQKVQIVLNDLDENGELHKHAIYKHSITETDQVITFADDYNLEDKRQYFISDKIILDSVTKIYER